MHRDSYGAREALRRDDLIVWTAQNAEGSSYAAMFNVGEKPLSLDLNLEEIDLSGITEGTELWSGTPAELNGNTLRTTIPAHGVRLYRF
ncbi:hypothetical protein D3C73_1099630 [compost metagenome]